MNKTVWILNHYAGNMFLVGGGRHYYIAKYLKESGFNPVIFCSNYDHFTKKKCVDGENNWIEKQETETEVPYIFIKTRAYPDNGTQRVLNMTDFYWGMLKVAKQYAADKGMPDVIYASSVHPLTLVAGIKLAKKFGVKCVCEVRDLWPESIVAYSSKWTRTNPLMRILYGGEKWIYKNADTLIFTMGAAYDYIVEQGWEKIISREKVVYINNGIVLEEFDENRERYQIIDEDLDDEGTFKVIYAGSIRKVNNLDKLLNVAKKVTNPRMRFLIWGDGDELLRLKERKQAEKIDNVVFKGRVPKDNIPYITSKADINFAHNEASPLFRFGISFNKVFDYLAAGRPILCDFYAKDNPVLLNNAGFTVDSGNETEIAAKLDEISSYPRKELDKIGKNARIGAKQYDYRILTMKLIDVLENA